MRRTEEPLSKLCHLITDGKHGDCQDRAGSGYFFLSAKDIKGERLDYGDARQITEEDFLQTHKRTQLEPDDIVLSNSGTIGRLAIVKDVELTSRTTFQKSVAILKPDRMKVIPRWLYYYLHYDLERLIGYAGGTAQKNLLLRDLRAFKIVLCSLDTQSKIATILSAYDDLIENNLRRIKTLEEMAQAIYREWFVHFRFPGHEKVKMVDSAMGKIPEGWKIGRLRDLVENCHDSTDPGRHLRDHRYVPIECISRHSLALMDSRSSEEAKSSLILFGKGDILFGAMRPYFHKVAIAPFDGVTRTTCFVLRPREPYLLGFAALTLFEEETIAYANAHCQGATIPYAVWNGSLAEKSVVVPHDQLLIHFNKVFSGNIGLMHNLVLRNMNLRQTRDLLLPKLISGDVDVSDLDIDEGNEIA